MKKIALLLIAFIMLISASACGAEPSASSTQSTGDITEASPTPSATPTPSPDIPDIPDIPEYPEETIRLTDLSEYVIVYPSYYSDYRMYEVYLLRDIIKKVTGFELEIISDGENARNREIIIASSARQNGVEDSINQFESGLDYIVGALNGNIILGGNNFYADMRAIYDFINNYLGYNDIDDIQSETRSSVTGVNHHIYKKPALTLLAANFSVSAFTEQYAIRDMHDAHFNLTVIDTVYYKDEQRLQNFLKWCARYEIFLIMRTILLVDLYTDCPIIWGHTIRDEPPIKDYFSFSDQCEEYLELYGKYGWKPYVNYFGLDMKYWLPLSELEGLFDTVPVISFDRYFGENLLHPNKDVLSVFEYARDLAQRKGQDLWSYIECYNAANLNQNTSKMLRWSAYVSLCFGAKGILYFQYGDASRNYTLEGDWSFGSLINYDFTKNPAWYDAQKTNEELVRLSEIYSQYENVGANTINRDILDISVDLESAYPYVDEFVSDFKNPENTSDTYLLGLFEKKESGAKAFIIMNVEDIDDIPYDQSEAKYAKIKINGENATFYLNGEPQNIERDSDGYYNINLANGYCWFVTID